MTTDTSDPALRSHHEGREGPSDTGWFRIACAALAGGALASFFVAAIDAHWAWHAGATASVPRLGLFVADEGLVAPFALLVSGLTGVVAATLAPRGLRAVTEDVFRVDADEPARARLSAIIGVGGIASLKVVVMIAHVARAVLGADVTPRVAGTLLAAATTVLVAAAVVAVEAIGRLAARRAPTWLPSPRTTAALVATLIGALFTWGVLSGTTNGDGGFLGILGVLKREELDLRGVFLLSVIGVGAGFAAEFWRRIRIPVAMALAAAALSFTVYASRWSLENRSVALAVERGAPFGSLPLTVLRKVSDRDHDGASALFGGGDCNDHDPAIHPGADDVPGNGVDEDCSGADDTVASATPPSESAAPAGAAAPHFPKGLNVILVTVDTLRADLGYAGNPRPVSPNIDALAKRSVVFERAYSLASYTGKSVGPLLLGKYPSETRRSFDHFDRFTTEETFVQERLHRFGVRTLTAQGHWYFKPDTGIGRGFDDADYTAEPRVPQSEGDRTVNGDKLTDAAIRVLSKPENVARSFYFWVHYLDPHAEYVPHPEFDFGSKSRDLYDGEVAFVDHHIGRLLAFVGASRFADRTAIVLTSDHGEAFGEHGIIRHGHELWEELVHVPLVIYVPGIAPHRVSTPRSAIDIVPTILDLFGAPPPSGVGTDFVSGRSLVSDLVPATGDPPPRPVLVDMSEGPYNDERQAFIDGQWKLVATNGRLLGLYDLGRDPGETHDLLGAESSPPIVARFKAFRRTVRTIPAVR